MSHGHDNPAILTTTSSEVEAVEIMDALREAGIKAAKTGGFTAGFRAGPPGYYTILVREGDIEAARKIYDAIEHQPVKINWDEVDLGERE